MNKSNQKSLNETIQNLNKVDAPKNITEGFFQSPEQKALNASLIQSIVEATFVEPIDEGEARDRRRWASWQRQYTKGSYNPEELPSEDEYERLRDNHSRRMKKRAGQTAKREAEAKNESFEPIDESGEAKGKRQIKSALKKLKKPIPEIKGLLNPEVLVRSRRNNALGMLEKGINRINQSQVSRDFREENESFEDKLKFAHIVKRLSKSALAARAAKIMARNEEFDGIAEEADKTPKPKRDRKPKAATPTPTPAPAKVTPKRVVVKPKAATPTPAPAKVTPKRVVVKPKAAATNSTVKSKRVSPFENLFAGKGHKLSNKTLALKNQYDQHRKQGHDEKTATDMVYAGVKAEGDKKNAIRNRILNTLNTPGESSTIQLARGLGKAVNRVGRGVNTVARGAGRVVNTLTDRQLFPTLGKSLARRAGRGVGNVSRAAMRSKVGKVVTAAATEYSRVRAANESIKVNEVNSTLGKLEAARKRRKTARLALNNSVIVDQTNLVNEAKPSAAVRREDRRCS